MWPVGVGVEILPKGNAEAMPVEEKAAALPEGTGEAMLAKAAGILQAKGRGMLGWFQQRLVAGVGSLERA